MGGRSLTFEAGGNDDWADAIAGLVKDGRIKRLEIARIDGIPAAGSVRAEALRQVGFADGYRGLILRG